jgi:flagellar hook-basal body complex protein FliE
VPESIDDLLGEVTLYTTPISLAQPVSALSDPLAIAPPSSSTPVAGPSFGDTLQNAFAQTNDLQNQAAQESTAFATGQVTDIHSVMIAAQKASVSLELTTQVRNQVVSAYQQIMQMQM